jgi:putative transposase
VWNRALGDWTDRWKAERHPVSYAEASKALTQRREAFDWLRAQPQDPQEQVGRDLYRAIGAFLDKANPAGRPKFKSKRRGYATARWTRNGFRVSGTGRGFAGDRLCVTTAEGRLPLRVVWSRPLPSVPSTVTVHRDRAGRWWASFVVRREVPDHGVVTAGVGTGLDVGLSVFATTEDPSTDVANPRYARQAAKARARSQRNVARKDQGSANRARARRRLARVEARVAAQRADFHHKAARSLVSSYDVIGVEKVSVKAMAARGRGRRRAGLNRSIADAGWSQFRQILEWQAKKAGKEIVVLDPSGTTQECSACGARAKPRIELSDRVFSCHRCGLVMNRDRNAARNLDPAHPRNRLGCTGGGGDGKKTRAAAGTRAA